MILTTEITEGGELYQQKNGVMCKIGLTGKELRYILVENETAKDLMATNVALEARVKYLEAEKLERTIKINRVMAEVDALSR